MAEAGRLTSYAKAYVELSTGSFRNESIRSIDKSSVPSLFIVSNNERFLKVITDSVQVTSKTVVFLILPGIANATELLTDHPGLSQGIAIWIENAIK